MNLLKKIYKLPYVMCWCILGIYVVIKNSQEVKATIKKITEGTKKDELEKFVKDLMWKYIVFMEKLKPHIIGIFWITILLLILK